ncbi:MAG TPA: DUF1272 domain-containing protein [Gammaproteobacteria bacterium]|nr:DUF1272 domain-containing protein [Gammaproteobacteria bacterium]
MLKLRLRCEFCDKDLPANSPDARICSYVLTFYDDCDEFVLHSDCPNCGGRFCKRPVRPKKARRTGVSLEFQMASIKRVVTRTTQDEIANFAGSYKSIESAGRQLKNR